MLDEPRRYCGLPFFNSLGSAVNSVQNQWYFLGMQKYEAPHKEETSYTFLLCVHFLGCSLFIA